MAETIAVNVGEEVISINDVTEIIAVDSGEVSFTFEDVSEVIQVELVDDTTNITVLEPEEVLQISTVEETLDCTQTEETLDFKSSEPTIVHVTEITNNVTAPGTTVITKTTGENIDSHSMVVSVNDLVFRADSSNIAHANIILGLTITSAISGQGINITTAGEVIEPAWSWTPNQAVFLSTGGNLTQSIPLTGFIIQIGFALTPTSLWLDTKIPLLIN